MCKAYIFLYTGNMNLYWIWLFVIATFWPGVYTSCVGQDRQNVLPFCTNATLSRKTIYLDSSAVSKDEIMTCYCTSSFSSSKVYVRVSYEVQNNTNCEMALYLGSNLYCKSMNMSAWEYLGEIKFEKRRLGSSSVCLRLEVHPIDPDKSQGVHPNMTVECFPSGDSHVPVLPPSAATLHPDPHSTPRPVSSAPSVNDTHVKDNQSSNSTTGNVGCPTCNCPACNCPACNCPACNCSVQEKNVQNVVNQNYKDGYSLGVLVGCSVGLFVGGCIIGIVVTLGVSFIRR